MLTAHTNLSKSSVFYGHQPKVWRDSVVQIEMCSYSPNNGQTLTYNGISDFKILYYKGLVVYFAFNIHIRARTHKSWHKIYFTVFQWVAVNQGRTEEQCTVHCSWICSFDKATIYHIYVNISCTFTQQEKNYCTCKGQWAWNMTSTSFCIANATSNSATWHHPQHWVIVCQQKMKVMMAWTIIVTVTLMNHIKLLHCELYAK
jgi:hypothetical protein